MYGTTTTTSATTTTTNTSSSSTMRRSTSTTMEGQTKKDVGWMTTMCMVRSIIHTSILLLPFLSILIVVVGAFSSKANFGDCNNDNNNDVSRNGKSNSNKNYIDDIMELSRFDPKLYQSMTEEPYISYPCMPRKIHLSQASNVDPSTDQISMTVSFTINRSFTSSTTPAGDGDSNDSDNGGAGGSCDYVQPRIIYGEKNWFSTLLLPLDGGLMTPSTNTIAWNSMEKMEFTYNSPKTHEHYVSDYIYHATLTNVTAGLKEYWYRIIVDEDEYEYEGRSHNDDNNHENQFLFNNQRLSSSSSSVSSVRRRRTLSLRGSKRLVGETPTYTFLTPPLSGGGGKGSSSSPTNIALVGDIGQTENSSKTMNHILQARNAPIPHPISTVIIAGDLSYADAEPYRWERWLDLMVRTWKQKWVEFHHEI